MKSNRRCIFQLDSSAFLNLPDRKTHRIDEKVYYKCVNNKNVDYNSISKKIRRLLTNTIKYHQVKR